MWGTILFMIIVGGITRLTGSGLSMVEWKPLFGAIPPLGDAEWQQTFERYQLFPQYQKVNSWMQLSDFKRIFFWEYLHRLWGRAIGLIYLLPMLYFFGRKKITGVWRGRVFVAFVLGGAQGLLGWFMVKSGLVDNPAVSHIRLAAHLMLAFLVAQYVMWLVLHVRSKSDSLRSTISTSNSAIGLLLLLQIMYGAFVAGTKGGYMYPTYPDFSGQMVPDGIFSLTGIWANLLSNPITIQFVHRYVALLLLGIIVVYWIQAKKRTTPPNILKAYSYLIVCVIAQMVLGILTVISGVNIVYAVAHQAVGFLTLSAFTYAVYLSSKPRQEPNNT